MTIDHGADDASTQASTADHGSWTCVLTLLQDFQYQKTFVELAVSVQPFLQVIVGEDDMADDNAVIDVTEGQDETVTCVAESVFPRPVFTWSLSGGSPGHIVPLDSQPRVSISPSSYLLTSYHTVRLNIPSITMNMSILTCHTKQYDYTGRLLYSTNTSRTIRILPYQPSMFSHPV